MLLSLSSQKSVNYITFMEKLTWQIRNSEHQKMALKPGKSRVKILSTQLRNIIENTVVLSLIIINLIIYKSG